MWSNYQKIMAMNACALSLSISDIERILQVALLVVSFMISVINLFKKKNDK
jgi:hypothetical protein